MRRMMVVILTLTLAAPALAVAQTSPEVWRGFVATIDLGSELHVRLEDGSRFRAVLIGVRDDAVLLQPRTRVPVAVQPVPYDAIVSLERRQTGGGIGAGKAAAIGVASGVGAFFATLLIFLVIAID